MLLAFVDNCATHIKNEMILPKSGPKSHKCKDRATLSFRVCHHPFAPLETPHDFIHTKYLEFYNDFSPQRRDFNPRVVLGIDIGFQTRNQPYKNSF